MWKINRDIKQYVVVLSSNILSMGLGFIINIISTNIMNTTSFGYYRAFINSLIMLSSISTLGFHWTIGRQFAVLKSAEEKKRVNSSGIAIISALSLITICVVLIGAFIYRFVLGKTMPGYIVLASIFLYVYIFQYYIQQKLQGENRMLTLSIVNTLPQIFIVLVLTAILISKKSIGTGAFIALYVLSNTVVLFYFLREGGLTIKIVDEIKRVVQENTKHGLQLYFGSLFSVTISQLLGLLIASIGGLEQYAFYSLGVSFAAPMALVASTMGTVQFKRNVNNKCINKNEIFITLLITGLAIISYFILLDNFMHMFIPGKYIMAISYAKILLIYYTMMGLGDYFNRFINSKGNGKALRNGAIITGITLIIFSATFIPLYKVNGLIVANLSSGLVYLLIMILIYRKTIAAHHT